MYPNRSWFETFKELNRGYVILGNNKSWKVLGIAIVRLRMFDGMKVFFLINIVTATSFNWKPDYNNFYQTIHYGIKNQGHPHTTRQHQLHFMHILLMNEPLHCFVYRQSAYYISKIAPLNP